MPLRGILAWLMPSSPHFEWANPSIVLHTLDYMTQDEHLHYAHIIGLGPRSKDIYKDHKEGQVLAILQDVLPRLPSNLGGEWGLYVNQTSHHVYVSNPMWQSYQPVFQLVIETEGRNFCYTPRPDFHIRIKGFPHLVLEVNSQSNQSDRYCTPLQAACIARIGNSLRGSATGGAVMIMAVYIDTHFVAHRYLLCQPDVKSVTVVFNSLTTPQTMSEFIFQLYNFLSPAVDNNNSFHDPEQDLAALKNSVERKEYAAFTTFITTEKRKHEGPKNASNHSRGPPAHGGAQGCFGNTSVQRELTTAGYTISEPISEELTPLPPVGRDSCRSAR